MIPEIDWSRVWGFFLYDAGRPLLFNSARFLLLFLVFYAIFLTVRRRVFLRTIYLLAFSVFFYYLSSGWFFGLLLASTLLNFVIGHYIARAPTLLRRRFYLWLSVGLNLAVLGYFKYTNFFIGTLNEAFAMAWPLQKIFLPVGISFFTFQAMSYTIDVYRGKIAPLTGGVKDIRSFFRQLSDFAFFISFFPQLVAGPIVRATDFIPQIRQQLQLSREDLGRALMLICGGLFKKAIISDYISVNFVDRVFDNPGLYSGLENLLAAYGYAIQIYCDFSGYSDMAIGLALLMGFSLPENFRAPYQALSIRDFWRRWHISLSTWLRDYLYVSLGGNQRGRFRTYVNLMLTMLLGGLWHGASWVFVIWGGLHGLALAADRFLENRRGFFRRPLARIGVILLLVQMVAQGVLWFRSLSGSLDTGQFQTLTAANMRIALGWLSLAALAMLLDGLVSRLRRSPWSGAGQGLSVFLVFHFVTLGWVFFRAGALGSSRPPLETTGAMLTRIAEAFHPELAGQLIAGYGAALGLIGLGFLLHYLPTRWDEALGRSFARAPLLIQSLALAFLIWLVIQTASADLVPFIYFQF